MSSTYITSFFPGNYFYTGDTDPNGVLSAPRGSQLIRTDAGNVRAYLNTDGATAWAYSPAIDPNGDLDLTGVDQILLTDNAATALQIGSTGALNLLRFVTTNGAEKVVYTGGGTFEITAGGLAVNAGGITIFAGGLSVNAGPVTLPENTLNIASVATDAANQTISAGLFLVVQHLAGASFVDTSLPARVGGWRIVDAYINSGGAAAGSVQVQTAGGATNITNTMVPGAAIGDITRASNVDMTNGTLASGATVRVNVAAGALAGTCFIRIEPR